MPTFDRFEAKTNLSRLVESIESATLVHRDPFDRLLVAQALAEPQRLLTYDKTLARYSGFVTCLEQRPLLRTCSNIENGARTET